MNRTLATVCQAIVAVVAGFALLMLLLILIFAEYIEMAQIVITVLVFGVPFVLLCLIIFFLQKYKAPLSDEEKQKTEKLAEDRNDAKEKFKSEQLKLKAERIRIKQEKKREAQEVLTLKKEKEAALGLSKQDLKRRKDVFMSDDQLLSIKSGVLPNLVDMALFMKPGERLVYSTLATMLETKRQAIGRRGGGAGVSVRVARGVSVHTGRSASQTVYGNITERFTGKMFITTERVVFSNAQKGFEQPLKKLTSVTPYSDGVQLQFGNRTFLFQLAASVYFTTALHLVQHSE